MKLGREDSKSLAKNKRTQQQCVLFRTKYMYKECNQLSGNQNNDTSVTAQHCEIAKHGSCSIRYKVVIEDQTISAIRLKPSMQTRPCYMYNIPPS